jgi:uncharacterized membrane protein
MTGTLATSRIEALTDGIFAIAMTLLVFNLILPDGAAQQANIGLYQLLYNQAAKFFHYVLAFMLLAIFWVRHHQEFHWIKRTDSRLLWINIFILLFVALMPFSTDIVGDYVGNTTANVFFAGNMLMLGLLFLANWAYATRNLKLLDPKLDMATIIQFRRRGIVIPAISAMVIVLSFFIPEWSLWLYLLTPFIMLLKPLRRST